MSSDTLAQPVAVPETPDKADLPRILPERRLGRWTAAVAVLVLLGPAVNSVLRDDAFPWGVVADRSTSDAVLRGLWLAPWLTAVVMVLGFVFQNFPLFPHLTVLENITEAPVSALRPSRREAVDAARRLPERAGLADKDLARRGTIMIVRHPRDRVRPRGRRHRGVQGRRAHRRAGPAR